VVGLHTIWAYYSGDSRFAASSNEELPVNHTVIKKSGTITVDPVVTDPVVKDPKGGGKGKTGRELAAEEKDLLPNELTVGAYPNPSNGMYELKLSGFADGMVKIQVLDMNGKQVWEEEVASSHEPYRLSLLDHAPGVYFCFVRQGKQTKMLRLIKN
jgi:hypothetical protein